MTVIQKNKECTTTFSYSEICLSRMQQIYFDYEGRLLKREYKNEQEYDLFF